MISILVKLDVGGGEVVEESVELEGSAKVKLAILLNKVSVVCATYFLLVALHVCIVNKEHISLIDCGLLAIFSILLCFLDLLSSLVTVGILVVLFVNVVHTAIDISLNEGRKNCYCISLASSCNNEDLDDRIKKALCFLLKSSVKLIHIIDLKGCDEVCLEVTLVLIVVSYVGRSVALVELILVGLVEVILVLLEELLRILAGKLNRIVDKLPNSSLNLLGDVLIISFLKRVEDVVLVLLEYNVAKNVCTLGSLNDLLNYGLKSCKLSLIKSFLCGIDSLLLIVVRLGTAVLNSLVVSVKECLELALFVELVIGLLCIVDISDVSDEISDLFLTVLVVLLECLEAGGLKRAAVNVGKNICSSNLVSCGSVNCIYREYVVGKLYVLKILLCISGYSKVVNRNLLLAVVGSELEASNSLACVLNLPENLYVRVGVLNAFNLVIKGLLGSNLTFLILLIKNLKSSANLSNRICIKEECVESILCVKSDGLVRCALLYLGGNALSIGLCVRTALVNNDGIACLNLKIITCKVGRSKHGVDIVLNVNVCKVLLDSVKKLVLLINVTKLDNVLSLGGRSCNSRLLHMLGEENVTGLLIYCIVCEVKNVALAKVTLNNTVCFLCGCDNLISYRIVDLCCNLFFSGLSIGCKIAVFDLKSLESSLEGCVIEGCVIVEILCCEVEAATACKRKKRHHNGKN